MLMGTFGTTFVVKDIQINRPPYTRPLGMECKALEARFRFGSVCYLKRGWHIEVRF